MIHTRFSDDAEHMAEAAREALTRPSDFSAWDERLFDTHGLVMSWAERGDDLIAESNYLTAVSMLEGAIAHDESGASEARGDDIIDGSSSHWLVGSMRELYVRVYDDAGEFTPAFREAVDIAGAIREYPLLDESDYSERENAAWESAVEDALDTIQRGYAYDSREQAESIRHLAYEFDHEEIGGGFGECRADADWGQVGKCYRAARDAFYEQEADGPYTTYVLGILPGQEPIPGLLVTA